MVHTSGQKQQVQYVADISNVDLTEAIKVTVHYSMYHYLAEYQFVFTYMSLHLFELKRTKNSSCGNILQVLVVYVVVCFEIFFRLEEIIGFNFVFSLFTPKSQVK